MSWPERLLAFFGDDRTFLCFAGLAAFGIVFTVTTNLTIIRDDNEVPPKEPKTQYITQETEDSLAIHTLDTLVSHHNYSIREVAIKILCDRALNDKTTFALLLDGITQRDHDGREKCLRALSLVIRTATGRSRTFLYSVVGTDQDRRRDMVPKQPNRIFSYRKVFGAEHQ